MSDAAKPARLLSLDALRGAAVVLMIEQHLGVWLWSGPGPGQRHADFPVLLFFNALGGGAAPAFILLAGIGSSLLIEKRLASGRPCDTTSVRRGLALLGFGLLLNLCTPSWFTWRSWFVLHLMGLGMLITPALRRLPTPVLLGLTGLTLACTPLIQTALGTPARLTNPYMSGRLDPPPWITLRIPIAEGQFPIFPWLSLYLSGLVCGRWIASGKLHRVAQLGLAAVGIGAVLAVLGVVVHPGRGSLLWWYCRLPVPFFPSSPALTSLLLGAVLLAIAGTFGWERRHPLRSDAWIVTLGRGSLSLLLFHVVAFREATRPIELWRALSPTATGLSILGFLLLAAVATRAWQRVDYRFGAEWLLRKLAP